ncbi:IS4 family transposase [Pseudarthrobacter sp. P1]|uniref:IS4 family transposase n=1 Tax=Pseudarthrobacter sp. P1 TaxID=3418418 RepID=UPI003CE9D6F1
MPDPPAAPAGPFAAGHLGELTRHLPPEMIDHALEATGRIQGRIRSLPARVVVYFVLASVLFPGLGYARVWRKLTSGLACGVLPVSAGALSQARRRIGAAPLRWIFDLLRGPAAITGAGGDRFRGLRVCAIDGTILTLPDAPAVLTRYTKQAGNHGGTGFPQARLVALVACGTRTLLDAVFGPTGTGETTYTPALFRSMGPGMIVLADRNFAARDLLAGIARTGAAFLVRIKAGRKLPVLARYPDGSYLSRLGPTEVRVIDAEITVKTTAGTQRSLYRLATSLTDHRLAPAPELIRPCHERWEIETSFRDLKSTMLGGKVLRSRTPGGIEQEIYAFLVAYQLLRTAMADATNTDPGLDPDRASFSIALDTATDLIIQAANTTTGSTIDLVGTIGRNVLAHLLPARRLRVCPRIVKRAISKYQARGPKPNRRSYTAVIDVEILTGATALTTPNRA